LDTNEEKETSPTSPRKKGDPAPAPKKDFLSKFQDEAQTDEREEQYVESCNIATEERKKRAVRVQMLKRN
jgi:hypothetical protein